MTAVILLLFSIIKFLTGLPPIKTLVISDKFDPLIVIGIPLPPLIGRNDVILGGLDEKPAKDAMPPFVFTLTYPGKATPTIALIIVSDSIVNDFAGNPPNRTSEAVKKLDPLIVIFVPLGPIFGLNEFKIGGFPSENALLIYKPLPCVAAIT
jgi:hypothetical protein